MIQSQNQIIQTAEKRGVVGGTSSVQQLSPNLSNWLRNRGVGQITITPPEFSMESTQKRVNVEQKTKSRKSLKTMNGGMTNSRSQKKPKG